MEETIQERPLVTFALFAYNQEEYIREAIEGALSQTYEPLEIILSDDCSSDRTFEIMQVMAAKYRGPHNIHVRRNEFNMGLSNHVNKVFDNSHGRIFIIAAGDDVSLPTRTDISVSLFNKHKNASSVLLSADLINSHGDVIGEKFINKEGDECSLQNIQDLLSWRHTTFGASRAIKRTVYTAFGELNSNCPTEDTPLLLRSLILGDNVKCRTKGIKYRKHDSNLSSIESIMGMDLGAIYSQYLDDVDKASCENLAPESVLKRIRNWILVDRKVREIKLAVASGSSYKLSGLIFLTFRTPKNAVEIVKLILLQRMPWLHKFAYSLKIK